MDAAERWGRFDEKWSTYDDEGVATESLKYFAVRGDAALVLFDEDGWFTMEQLSWNEVVGRLQGKGRTLITEGWSKVHNEQERRSALTWLYACYPDGTPHDVYCEPIWLCGYYETIMED